MHRAVVTLRWRDIYLGDYGAPQGERPASPTVIVVIAAFLRFADRYCRQPDWTHASEFEKYKNVLANVLRLYGREPAATFRAAGSSLSRGR